MIPYALSYADVEPVYVDLSRDFELALIGNSKNGDAQLTFNNQLLYSLIHCKAGVHIRIVDGLEKKLREYRDKDNVHYATEGSAVIPMLAEMAAIAEEN